MAQSQCLQVLIVEDDPLVALDEAQIIESIGHQVIGVAIEAAEAVGMATDRRPSVALVDVNLADGLTGPTLCAWLVGTCGVPVVFVTGNPELLPPSYAGALGCIVKPYAAHMLEAALAFAGHYGRAPDAAPPPGMLPAPGLTALQLG
jgi:response regulator of citrate/malate metabolism